MNESRFKREWRSWVNNEQALVSLKLKKSIDAEGGCTFAVIIEGG